MEWRSLWRRHWRKIGLATATGFVMGVLVGRLVVVLPWSSRDWWANEAIPPALGSFVAFLLSLTVLFATWRRERRRALETLVHRLVFEAVQNTAYLHAMIGKVRDAELVAKQTESTAAFGKYVPSALTDAAFTSLWQSHELGTFRYDPITIKLLGPYGSIPVIRNVEGIIARLVFEDGSANARSRAYDLLKAIEPQLVALRDAFRSTAVELGYPAAQMAKDLEAIDTGGIITKV